MAKMQNIICYSADQCQIENIKEYLVFLRRELYSVAVIQVNNKKYMYTIQF